MIKQLTVFLENTQGRLAAVCRCLGDAGINMQALTIADTSDYGLVRIICDDPERAAKVLSDAGFRAYLKDVAAIQAPNRPGGLADLLETLDDLGVNIEYGYCFSTTDGHATEVLKITNPDEAAQAAAKLEAAGFKVLTQEDIA